MPLHIVRNDITKMKTDAIVNAANSSLLGGGGVDGAIHRAAGSKLLDECRTLGGCKTGSAKITRGYELFAKYVIHTVGPIWQGGKTGERELLISCYKTSLALAKEYNCESVAFPLISAGAYGYPKHEAFRIAVDTITEFLAHEEMTVYLVIFDGEALTLGKKLFAEIEEFIDERYIEEHSDKERRRDIYAEARQAKEFPKAFLSPELPTLTSLAKGAKKFAEKIMTAPKPSEKYEAPHDDFESVELYEEASELFPDEICAAPASLDDALRNLDESFSEMLFRKIDECGISDAECYKRANISRKHFSKIRCAKDYKPSKPTVIAFAVALRLSLDETHELLKKAGFALSRSNKFDIIVEYFLLKENYDIFAINEALFAFDQPLLGA